MEMKFSALGKNLFSIMMQVTKRKCSVPVLRYDLYRDRVYFVPTCPIIAGQVTYILFQTPFLWNHTSYDIFFWWFLIKNSGDFLKGARGYLKPYKVWFLYYISYNQTTRKMNPFGAEIARGPTL